MTSPQQQIIDKCKTVYALAKTLYNVDMTGARISFDLRGRVAGTAARHRGVYCLRFNGDLLLRELECILNDVVPHEIAHLICFARRDLGKDHDNGWRRVCIALGGSGKSTHNMEVVYGNGRTYEYITTRGHKVRLSERRHKSVQSGSPLTYRRGLGEVTQQCAYSIVGVSGRTLQEPVVRQPAILPAQTLQITDLTGKTPVHSVVTLPPMRIPTPLVITPLPRNLPVVPRIAEGGTSKAAVSRSIMAAGYRNGESYEAIISKMITANGYNRQLARATFKANAARVNIPATFGD